MKVTKFDIEGPILIEPKVLHDDRGFFTERFRSDLFRDLGITNNFIQDNYSLSNPGVLRGLHYQYNPPQGKLVTCMSGRIFDVAVDIRRKSRTFGKWISVELDANHPAWFWVPAGFAHGFCVLGHDPAGVLYKVDANWCRTGEQGLMWCDAEINISWPIKNPTISNKDEKLSSFRSYASDPNF